MVVKTIFDVAEFQKKKKQALEMSGKTKLTVTETNKLKKQADKPLDKYKNLKVVELTKGGKPTGRYFLRGELKTKGGGMRWRILGKADKDQAIKKYGKVGQPVKAKPAKRKKAAKKTPTKAPAKRGPRRGTTPARRPRKKTREQLLAMTTEDLRDEAKSARPAAKLSRGGKAFDKMQLVDLIDKGKPGKHGRKSPRAKSPKRGRRATTPRKTSTKRKKATKGSPKQDLLNDLKMDALRKVAKDNNMRVKGMKEAALREHIRRNLTKAKIEESL